MPCSSISDGSAELQVKVAIAAHVQRATGVLLACCKLSLKEVSY